MRQWDVTVCQKTGRQLGFEGHGLRTGGFNRVPSVGGVKRSAVWLLSPQCWDTLGVLGKKCGYLEASGQKGPFIVQSSAKRLRDSAFWLPQERKRASIGNSMDRDSQT